MVADRRHDAGGKCEFAHHAPGVDLGHRLIGERSAAAPAAGAEQKRFLVGRDAGGGDVGAPRRGRGCTASCAAALPRTSVERVVYDLGCNTRRR
jgi:hypothetical protein